MAATTANQLGIHTQRRKEHDLESIIKEWKGDQMAALSLYQADANLMAEQGYFPVSQEWKPSPRVFLCVIGIMLIPVGIGIVILLSLLFTQNSKGCWTVKYAYREKTQSPFGLSTAPHKTCPKCAEEVKDAAAICRFCNYEFAANRHAVDLCESAK
jgi:hypothetical protein